MSPFELDPRLEVDTLPIAVLELCDVRLMNDRRYPWLILVPRRAAMEEWIDLGPADQALLWDEIRRCARLLRQTTGAEKLNIAALGNQVRQLHVHVIARHRDDDAWPNPVWGQLPPVPYPDHGEELRQRIAALLETEGR